MQESTKGPIGVFDSGYGGLTILRDLKELMPQYDYMYLGDNARAPYGSRSFDVVYQFTKQAVKRLFDMGCPLVILACNTASAKALRSIQQTDLPLWAPEKRVLGIIRPTVEQISSATKTRHVGLFATKGTISSKSYEIETAKLAPDVVVSGHACPMWVPLVENQEYASDGADFFVKKEIEALFDKDPEIDTIILGCTHYPLLMDKIKKYLPQGVKIMSQGQIVASSLHDYLWRHPEIQQKIGTDGICTYLSTESQESFSNSAKVFLKEHIEARHIDL